jgi:hypothetical protein
VKWWLKFRYAFRATVVPAFKFQLCHPLIEDDGPGREGQIGEIGGIGGNEGGNTCMQRLFTELDATGV